MFSTNPEAAAASPVKAFKQRDHDGHIRPADGDYEQEAQNERGDENDHDRDEGREEAETEGLGGRTFRQNVHR